MSRAEPVSLGLVRRRAARSARWLRRCGARAWRARTTRGARASRSRSGAVLVAASLVALAPLAPLDDRADLDLLDPELRRWFAYVVGVAFLGLLDDALGRGAEAGHARGWRGHARAVLAGGSRPGRSRRSARWRSPPTRSRARARGARLPRRPRAAAAGDQHGQPARPAAGPGREDLLRCCCAGLCLGDWTVEPLELLGLFIGPVIVGAWFTLRERAMLGDTGSNLVGALIGVWLVTTLGDTARLIALGVVARAYGLWGVSLDLASDRAGSATAVTRLARQSESGD